MSMSDPIGDMLTRIRNAQKSRILTVICAYSKIKNAVAEVLRDEGYVSDIRAVELDNNKKSLEIDLKYSRYGKPVISEIKRVSKPGKRVMTSIKSLRPNRNNLGIYVVSTSLGVFSDRVAMKHGVGGEVICKVF